MQVAAHSVCSQIVLERSATMCFSICWTCPQNGHVRTPTTLYLLGVDRATGAEKWTAIEVDLVFGSNSELRAVAKDYAHADSQHRFTEDFVVATLS